MRGWIVPPPKESEKTREQFAAERAAKVRWLTRAGYLKASRIRRALLEVPREVFIPAEYRDYSYLEVPLPLPGVRATISCPHSYPLFYEPLALDEGHRFLEIGTGSGYGAAVAREVVGPRGRVVSAEIDPTTLEFARGNLERAGYDDIVLMETDGGLGVPELAPYDRISVTAACRRVPDPLIDQLAPEGKLIAPVFEGGAQQLMLLESGSEGLRERRLVEVLYVNLRGAFGEV